MIKDECKKKQVESVDKIKQTPPLKLNIHNNLLHLTKHWHNKTKNIYCNIVSRLKLGMIKKVVEKQYARHKQRSSCNWQNRD